MPRVFRSHPGYVAMSTFVLAIAVGVNLVVFTLVNAIWIRPLPFSDPDRLVTIPRESTGTLEHERFKIFEGGVAGQVLTAELYQGLQPRIEIPGINRELETIAVTPGYFRLFGLTVRGRDFNSVDDQAGAEPVAIISNRLWSAAFQRRTQVVGTVVPAVPFPIRIIGIAPEHFEGARRGERVDMWIPTSLVRRLVPQEQQQSRLPMIVFGRLGPGQTPAVMDQRYRDLMNPRDREWLLQYDRSWAANPVVVPLEQVFGTPTTRTFMVRERDAVLVVSGLALLVLLGGCATLAALVLVHYERRRGELALKIALGAGSSRLMRDLARDLSMVALTGSAGGLLVAFLGLKILPAMSLPGGVDLGRLDLSIDWRVCAVAIAVTIASLLAAAALPTFRSTRPRIAGDLFAGISSTSFASQRLRQTLLALQVSGTIVVLVAAGLFVRAVSHGFRNAPGFEVDQTVFVSVREQPVGGDAGEDRRKLVVERTANLMRILRGLPGVDVVAEGHSPIGPQATNSRLNPRTVKVDNQEHQLWIGRLTGSPELLSAIGVPLIAGRHLTASDSEAVPIPAVITKSLAERLWPSGEPLGQTLSITQLRGGPYAVVGIVRDLAFGSLTRPGNGIVVTVGSPASRVDSHFVIRTTQPEVVAGHVRRSIKGHVVTVATGTEILAQDLGRQRLGAWFFSGFGLAALILGVGGVFGLVAYLAESQRREFGVRLALGATAAHLVRRGLAAALIPVGFGVGVGLALSGVVSQVFATLLAGIHPLDLTTYLLVALAMLGCAALAALAAAWRLHRVTPSDALRST